MKVAVVTPYYKEPYAELDRCMNSVQAQTYSNVVHYMVSDGHPSVSVEARHDAGTVRHLPLGASNGDYGDTPRAVGSMLAACEGADAICYLDADNWYDPTHIEQFVAAYQAAPADVLTCRRYHVRIDGTVMHNLPPSHQDGLDHVDTGCYFITRNAFDVLPVWGLKPKQLAVIDDRVIYNAIKGRGLSMRHLQHATMAYKNTWCSYYEALGEVPPPGCKGDPDMSALRAWWHGLRLHEQMKYSRIVGFDIETMLAGLHF